MFFTAREHCSKVPRSLFAAQYGDFTPCEYHHHPSVKHLSTHQGISLGQKIVHVHHSENHLMEQVVYTFGTKRTLIVFVITKGDFVFSSIVITNIQKTLQSTNAGPEHTYIISKH